MKASTLASNPDTRTSPAGAARWEGLSAEDLLRAYRTMLLSRRIDDKEIQLKNQSLIFFQISGAGHEAVLTAAGMHLRAGYDWFYPYYRDRALCLTLGMTSLEMLLAAVGAEDDPNSGGRQMPSHWGHRKLNIPSQGSPTGTQCLHAVGAGEAGMIYERVTGIADREQLFHSDEITYLSIGEGATSEGEFWESLNTACTKPVPVLYVVEDNGYAISVPVEVQTPGGDVSRLVESFPNLKLWRCDGTDFLESYRTLGEAAAYVRRERKPAFVHAKVIRPYSHSLSDDERLYKTPEERKSEATRDPLTKMRAFLLKEQIATESDLEAVLASVDREIAEATDLALKAPKPSVDSAASFVFSPTVDPTSTQFLTTAQPEGKPDTMVGAINRTMKDEMARNPRIVVFGEDVADASKATALAHVPGKGGVFKVTHGLQKTYGADRVFNSPLAEANIVGRAVGMATRGLKPVVEIQFFDYIWPAMMQLKDEMSMLRYRSGNNWSCPMVVRVPIGGYLRGGAPYHSQSGVSIFAHCPGVRIAFPSNAIDAAGLLRTAIRCDDPVLYLEHKHLYRQTYNKGIYPGPDYMIPFGKGSLRRDGTDMVVLTWGALVQRSLLAAQQAEKDGISVAVFDLRTIMPYDWDGIAGLVKKTNRVIVAHEDTLTCGFGAEIAARIGEDLFEYLDAPVKRVAALDCPVAYCPDLEEKILPQSADVLAAIKTLAAYYSLALLVIVFATTAALGNQAAVRVSPGTIDVLRSIASLPPHVVGLFRDPIGFKQTANGDYYVFDRRGHTVYRVDPSGANATKLVQIGAEEGRLIEPSAFDVAANGTFAVADGPNGRERISIFNAAGSWTGGFFLPGRGAARIVLGSLALNGVGTLSFNGRSLLMSHPETGWLMTEYGSAGTPIRSIGQLRKTGHESDRDLHLALNSGIPIADPNGGFYFVFMAGAPAFRKYTEQGELVYERMVQGREIDPLIEAIPDRWPRRAAGELPLVAPTVRTAAVDRSGVLWISFVIPLSYVYDASGEKVRTVQFRAAGVLSPSSLWFNDRGRVLITPGCYEFATGDR